MPRRPGQRTAARLAIFESAMRPARVLLCAGGRTDQLTGAAALRENGWLDFSPGEGEWTSPGGRDLDEVSSVSFPPGTVLQVEWLAEGPAAEQAAGEDALAESGTRECEVNDAPRRLTRTAR